MLLNEFSARLFVVISPRLRTMVRRTLAAFCVAFLSHNTILADDISYLNQSDFQIPIQMTAAKAAQLKSLRLYVSTDRGTTWKMERNATPSQKAFNFKTREDGEYWFTLAYVDQADRVEPADVRTEPPGLKIVVDTKPPLVELRPLPRDNDKVGVTWKLTDEKLDLASLRIEARTERDSNWRELPINRMSLGQVDWAANPEDGYVIRASVKDLAGNRGVMEASIPPEMTRRQEEFASSAPSPMREGQPFAPPPPPARVASPAPFPVAGESVFPSRTAPEPMVASAAPSQPPSPSFATARVPVAIPNREMNGDRTWTANSSPRTFDRTSPDFVSESVPAVSRAEEPNVRSTADGEYDRAKWLALAASAAPVASTQAPAVRQVSLPEAPPKQVVKTTPLAKSPHLNIDYELRGVGPAGVGKVELYYTADNGQEWKLYGEDADRTPPFEVAFPGEGRFGFKIIVTSPAGYGQKPPQKGDTPQMVVEIDSTPPQADLYQPVPDTQSPGEAMLISWSARDPHLPNGPVALFFSLDRVGWFEIQTNLPAVGQYSWKVPKNIGTHQVYLRLMARDQVDNVSVADTPDPVVIDLSRPEAEAVGIAVLPDGKLTR